MNISMLDYCKQVLSKVRFSRKLFIKEYRKARRWLTADEHHELKTWLREDKAQATTTINLKQKFQ